MIKVSEKGGVEIINGFDEGVKEILIVDRPDILQTIVDGIGNSLAPYGGISPGGEKLFFVGLVLGYAKPDPVDQSIKKFATTSFCANFTNIKASTLYDSAARQAAMAENKIASEPKGHQGDDRTKVQRPTQ